MRFENLPTDIIYRVQSQIISRKKLYYAQWKDALPLLWCSHSWRQVSLSTLYGCAVIECIESESLRQFSYSSDNSSEDNALAGVKWMSTLGFIKLLGSGNTLHSMILTQKVAVDPKEFLQQAAYLLRSENITFHNVQTLEIKFAAHILADEDETEEEENESEEEEDESEEETDSINNKSYSIANRSQSSTFDEIENVVNILANNLPKIRQLEILAFPSFVENSILKIFCSKLIKVYARQLKLLTCHICVDNEISNFTDQLQILSLRLPEDMRVMPNINASTIKKLIIVNVPNKLPWSQFENIHTPGNIYFDNLERLDLSDTRIPYTSETQPPLDPKIIFAHVPKIHLPKLRSLNMELCPNEYLTLIKDWQPEVAKYISISGTVSHVRHGPFSRLKQIDEIMLLIEGVSINDQDEFYKLTNHLFGKVRVLTSASLMFCKPLIGFDIQRMSWPNLNHLDYTMPVDLFDILDMLQILPSLISIHIYKLTFDRVPDVVGNYLSPDWHALASQPLQSKLQRFCNLCYFNDYSATFASSICLYLMVCIPTLNVLEAYERFKNEIEEARQHLSATYPRLSNTKLKYPAW